MTLAEAIPLFLDYAAQKDSPDHPQGRSAIHNQTLMLLSEYFSSDRALADITTESLREFISRWYVEKAGAANTNDRTRNPHRVLQAPEAPALLDSLAEFFTWADFQAGEDQAVDYTPILTELSLSLPRAQEIMSALSSWVRKRSGAFTFPEFLTSFEDGGASRYDIDAPGKVGAIDGYFRVIRIDGFLVEAEELITEERIWPIVFAPEVAALLDDGYIISLELVRKPDGWQIAGCGFAYPPGTKI
jgi:hypothetical protein